MTYLEQVDALLNGYLDRSVIPTDPALESLDAAIALAKMGREATGMSNLMTALRDARRAGDRELAERLREAVECYQDRRSYDRKHISKGGDDSRGV